LEAKDLVALLEFLVSPTDDLKLAHALRSPIFNCADGDLCSLAMAEGEYWWERLVTLEEGGVISPALQRACQLLRGWLDAVDRLPVHDLLDRIFFQGEVDTRYQFAAPAHLRSAVQANLQALMALALATDSGRYPSLPRFLYELSDFRRGAEDEAPDEGTLSATENAVRIMTIHGAKGLEAPIVLIADSNASAKRGESYGVLSNWPVDAAAPHHFSLFSTADERGQARKFLFDDESEIEVRENWNLLYVAMTRAKQMLIVSGSKSARAGEWYQRVAAAVDGLPDSLPSAVGETPFRSAEFTPGTSSPIQVPAVGARRAIVETDDTIFGIHFHAMLERLTTVGTGADIADIRVSLRLPIALFDEVYALARNIIESPSLRRFYNPTLHLRAFNEVEYVGQSGEIRRIDRLIEFDDCVWILDYKSGTYARADYAAQLTEYRLAVRELFPNKRVHCGLVFRDGRLEEVLDSMSF
jgi:ATP-dependent helicase/nuclease subunit A